MTLIVGHNTSVHILNLGDSLENKHLINSLVVFLVSVSVARVAGKQNVPKLGQLCKFGNLVVGLDLVVAHEESHQFSERGETFKLLNGVV